MKIQEPAAVMSDIEAKPDRVEQFDFEMELKNIDAQLTQTKQLQKTQQDLKEAYEKIGQMFKTQRGLREQINVLQANVNTVTEKYNEALSMYVSDFQVNNEYKERSGTIDQLTAAQDKAIIALKKLQNGNEAASTFHEKEKHDLKQRLNDLMAQNGALNDQLSVEKQKIDKFLVEIASIKQEKNQIKSELSTVQMDHQIISEENSKLSNDIIVIEQKNARMSNELKEMTDKMNIEENRFEQVRKIAVKYKKLFNDLQKKHDGLVEQKALHQSLNETIEELSNSIVNERQQSESLRMENETLSKRLSELDAEYAIASNTIQTLTEEKKRSEHELMEVKTQSESHIKSLMRESEALQVRFSRLHHDMTNASRAKPSTMPTGQRPSHIGFTTNPKLIPGMLCEK